MTYLSRSIVDAEGGPIGAPSVVGLTRIYRHAHSSVTTVALVADTPVLVGSGLDTGSLGMADLLDTRVLGCGGQKEEKG